MNYINKFIRTGILISTISPVFAFAAGTGTTDVLTQITRILAYIIPILITLGVVYFVWGVIQYTLSPNEETKKGARGKIINGLIGLLVIMSFWGIVRVVTNTFDIGPNRLIDKQVPCFDIKPDFCP